MIQRVKIIELRFESAYSVRGKAQRASLSGRTTWPTDRRKGVLMVGLFFWG